MCLERGQGTVSAHRHKIFCGRSLSTSSTPGWRCSDGSRVVQESQERGQRRTRGASGAVKASARHGADHATGAGALRGNVEAAAAHMAMLARVGGCHRLVYFWEGGVWARVLSGSAGERFWSVSGGGGPSCARLIEGQRGPRQGGTRLQRGCPSMHAGAKRTPRPAQRGQPTRNESSGKR